MGCIYYKPNFNFYNKLSSQGIITKKAYSMDNSFICFESESRTMSIVLELIKQEVNSFGKCYLRHVDSERRGKVYTYMFQLKK